MNARLNPIAVPVAFAVLLVIRSASASHAQQSAPLSPCGVQGAVLKLAHQLGMAVGLETTCSDQTLVPPIVAADFEEPRPEVTESLARLVAEAPDYEWRNMHGLVVVRPVAAWNDPHHFLTRPVKSFTATGSCAPDCAADDLRDALAALSEPVAPLSFGLGIDRASEIGAVPRDRKLSGARRDPSKPPYLATFPGGTLLEALNALTRGRRGGGWVISYCGRRPAVDSAILNVALFNEQIGFTTHVALKHENGYVNPCLPAST